MKFPNACYASICDSTNPFVEWYDTEKEVKNLDEGAVVVEYLATRTGQIVNGKLDWSVGLSKKKIKAKAKSAVKKVDKKIVKKKTKKV